MNAIRSRARVNVPSLFRFLLGILMGMGMLERTARAAPDERLEQAPPKRGENLHIKEARDGCGSIDDWRRTNQLIDLPGCLRASAATSNQTFKRILISVGLLAPSLAPLEDQQHAMRELYAVCEDINSFEWDNDSDKKAYIKACSLLKEKLIRGAKSIAIPQTKEERIQLSLTVRQNALMAIGDYMLLTSCKNLQRGVEISLANEKHPKGIEILKQLKTILTNCEAESRHLEAQRKILATKCKKGIGLNEQNDCIEQIDILLTGVEEIKRQSRNVISPLIMKYQHGE